MVTEFTLLSGPSTPIERNKGNSLLSLEQNYCSIDIETTGFMAAYDDIIEVAAVQVRDGEVVNEFTSLVNPGYEIDSFITDLTGITNEMLASAPPISEVIGHFHAFIGDDILLGHNVNFDINFLYDSLMRQAQVELNNDFVDTLRISRLAFPGTKHHRLSDMKVLLNLNSSGAAHYALQDALVAHELYQEIQANYAQTFYNRLELRRERINNRRIRYKGLEPNLEGADPSHPFYEKNCVLTGALDSMTRKEAIGHILELGGMCKSGVTKQTNFLITGSTEYIASLQGEKSAKWKKAQDLQLSGYDIVIIAEDEFLELISGFDS